MTRSQSNSQQQSDATRGTPINMGLMPTKTAPSTYAQAGSACVVLFYPHLHIWNSHLVTPGGPGKERESYYKNG